MAHECTNCGRGFPDGSTEMLSGCPECGGNRFQYLPDGVEQSVPQDSSEDDRSLIDAVLRRGDDDDMIEAEPDPDYLASMHDRSTLTGEDPAQTDARSTTISADQLPNSTAVGAMQGDVRPDDPEPDPEPQPDLADLREQLEDRFESIKIVDRGEYELNLMELYERRECIIELQENGRYAIEVPESLTK